MSPRHPSDCGGPFQLGACVRARRGPGGVTPGWLSALAPVALAPPSPARRLQSCHFTPEGTQGPRAGPRPGPRAGARKTPGPGPGRQAIAAVSRAPRLGWPLSGVLENQAQSWGPGREGPCEVPGRVGAILNADRRPCTPAPRESGVSPQGLRRTSGRLWSLVSCPASLDMVTVGHSTRPPASKAPSWRREGLLEGSRFQRGCHPLDPAGRPHPRPHASTADAYIRPTLRGGRVAFETHSPEPAPAWRRRVSSANRLSPPRLRGRGAGQNRPPRASVQNHRHRLGPVPGGHLLSDSALFPGPVASVTTLIDMPATAHQAW